jgi:hypothetical protein
MGTNSVGFQIESNLMVISLLSKATNKTKGWAQTLTHLHFAGFGKGLLNPIYHSYGKG